MIKTATNEKGITTFIDDSENLSTPMLRAVHAAMRAGLTEFTTPTPEDDQKRIDWRVRNWVTNSGGKLAAFRVAYKESFAQFEVIGPEIDLVAKPTLEQRAMAWVPPSAATIRELAGANAAPGPPPPPHNVPLKPGR